MDIQYPSGKTLELWVRDKGEFDGIAIFLNGQIVGRVVDQKTHKFPLMRPPVSTSLRASFGGNDGGVSAIVDVTNANEQMVIGKQDAEDGIHHDYNLVPV